LQGRFAENEVREGGCHSQLQTVGPIDAARTTWPLLHRFMSGIAMLSYVEFNCTQPDPSTQSVRPKKKTQKRGHPLAGRSQAATKSSETWRRTLLRRLRASCSITKSRPFSHSTGCEANRASHPSGSSGTRCGGVRPGGIRRPRKMLVPNRVQSCCAQTSWLTLARASPSWLMVWAIRFIEQLASVWRPLRLVVDPL
jgi:hypothetical protein